MRPIGSRSSKLTVRRPGGRPLLDNLREFQARAEALLVSVDIKGEPPKASMKKLLKPSSLAYHVKGGVLTITSEPADAEEEP